MSSFHCQVQMSAVIFTANIILNDTISKKSRLPSSRLILFLMQINLI